MIPLWISDLLSLFVLNGISRYPCKAYHHLLGLLDCSSCDFFAHIAHVSLVMIRYNMLAYIKRTLDYDTIGGLFGDMYLGVHELTVVEKIWAIIMEVVAVVAELTGADSDELTIQIIENDKRLAALRAYAQTA